MFRAIKYKLLSKICFWGKQEHYKKRYERIISSSHNKEGDREKYKDFMDADAVDLSICAIMRDEAPYVKEWIDYHLLVGVKRFYIYDNESNDNLKDILKPYIAEGVVVYKYQPGESQQQVAYDECLQQYRRKTRWLAYIDADEFIVPVKEKTIPDFLKGYEKYAAVAINWIQYDSNGHNKKPEGGVLENYTRVYYHGNQPRNTHIKSICQPHLTLRYRHPHFGEYKKGYFAVTENGKRIDGPFTAFCSVERIRVNHYYSKSIEEYMAKINRGRADRKQKLKKAVNPLDYAFYNFKYDYNMWKYVAVMKGGYLKQFARKIVYDLKNIPIYLSYANHRKEWSMDDFIDGQYYQAHYPDYKNERHSAREHYMQVGWRKGYNPSRYFDSERFLEEKAHISKGRVSPLWHYIQFTQYTDEKLKFLRLPFKPFTFSELKRISESGDQQAQYILGNAYREGEGVQKNETEAAKWYLKSAGQGNSYAQYALGNAYLKGEGVQKNTAEAVKWFRKSAEQGNSHAQCALGDAYSKGEGVRKDTDEAVKWYKESIRQWGLHNLQEKAAEGNQYLQFVLGDAYWKGEGVRKNITEALKWFRKSAEKGEQSAQYRLGDAYRRGVGVELDLLQAVRWFKKSAELGNQHAQYWLGDAYWQGGGVPKDVEEAVKWFRESAKQGNRGAQLMLGNAYRKGIGIPKDEVKAVKWFRKSAEQGNRGAQLMLGDAYRRGAGIQKDETEAVKWFKKSAEQGNQHAQYWLGDAYRRGAGVQKDETEAMKWFRKSAELGNQGAQTALQALSSL